MGKTKLTALLVCALLLVTVVVLGGAKSRLDVTEPRVYHHELSAGADSSIGTTTIPATGKVTDKFTTHLPLLIIDTGGQEIVNYKRYDAETESYVEREGVDPYFPMTLSVIDNPNFHNTPADAPTMEVLGKIKVRGNHSSDPVYAKNQYRIQLLDEEGNNASVPLLGMDSDDDWVLNGTMRDKSYMRNYLALNLTGTFMPYVPDMRYCEVLLKNGGNYDYLGLYILYEKVQRGPGRVELSAYDPKQATCSYLVRRDRWDDNQVMLDTWATREQKYDRYLGLIYPNEKTVTPESVAYIEQEISRAERIIYSDNPEEFMKYPNYIDVDSFVDYYVAKEFFGAYDDNSIYMYREAGGKLCMGPVWDIDMGMDNWYGQEMTINGLSHQFRALYDHLLRDPAFLKKIETRYAELRRGIFSDENVSSFIDETYHFLGNAILRDTSRWSKTPPFPLYVITDKASGFPIDRNRDTVEEELVRIKDVLAEHGSYMDRYLWTIAEDIAPMPHTHYNQLFAVFMITVFILSIILVQRPRRS